MSTLNLGTFAPTNLAIDLNQEIFISCFPGLHSRYFGTEEQLRNEGLVPDFLHFPSDSKHIIRWNEGTQERTLQRARRSLMPEKVSMWASDCVWCVQVDVT